MTKKIGVIASVCTILGLCLSLYSSFASSDGEVVNNNVHGSGSGSIIMGSNSGTVTVYNNQKNENEKRLVLKNKKGGAAGIIKEPAISSLGDPTQIICYAIAGTPVALTGNTASMNGLGMWKEISVLEGECAGKIGWAATSNLAYE